MDIQYMKVYKWVVEGDFYITGRGPAILVNFEKNNITNGSSKYTNKMLGFFRGKIVYWNERLWRIKGAETMGHNDREVKETSFLLTPLIFYRTPTKEELYEGMEVEMRVHGEYDMEICKSWMDEWDDDFNDEKTGWHWKKTKLEGREYELFKEYEGDIRTKGLPTQGFIRIREEK